MLAWAPNNHRNVDGVQLCVIYLMIVKMHAVSTAINGRQQLSRFKVFQWFRIRHETMNDRTDNRPVHVTN